MTTVLPTETVNWRVRGACASHDPEVWYDLDDALAVAICRTCPVTAECRAWVDQQADMWGVWAGETQQQRRDRIAGREGRAPSMSYIERVNRVRRLARQGHADSAIGIILDIPESSVRHIRNANHIPAGAQQMRRQQAAAAGLSQRAAARLAAGAR